MFNPNKFVQFLRFAAQRPPVRSALRVINIVSEYDWLEYSLTWFEKSPREGFVGEAILLWLSKSMLVANEVIDVSDDFLEGELAVKHKHLKWLNPISPVRIDMEKYDYFVGLSGCWHDS